MVKRYDIVGAENILYMQTGNTLYSTARFLLMQVWIINVRLGVFAMLETARKCV